MGVAVLFARSNSVYKSIPGCDVWDAERDARKWPGGSPVIAHPPCRAWGRYAHWSKHRPDERQLATWAIDKVRRFGGVLEHPITSALWSESGCLGYGMRDHFGGVLVPVLQSWWGHRAPKETGLYIVGPVPELPYDSTPAHGRIENMGRAERERTPEPFARFLVSLAESCQ
jgi:hypothetical protein